MDPEHVAMKGGVVGAGQVEEGADGFVLVSEMVCEGVAENVEHEDSEWEFLYYVMNLALSRLRDAMAALH